MQTLRMKMKSRVLDTPTELIALLPEPPRGQSPDSFYRSGKKYKVLWLLHGGSGDCEDWLTMTGLVRYVEGRELVVIMPSALNSDYANHPEFAGGYFFTDFFFGELMPFVYGWLPVSEAREDNYLAGLSMGASGSFLLGFCHPEKFAGLGIMSGSLRNSDFLKPYRELTAAQFKAAVEKDRTAFPTEFADPKKGITNKEVNMIAKYPTVGAYLDSYECLWERFPEAIAAGTLPPVYVTSGMNDMCYHKQLDMKARGEACGAQNITYEFVPGYGHEWAFWDIAVQKVLVFFGL